MKSKFMLFVWAALVTIVLIGSLSFARQGIGLITEDFASSNDISWRIEEFYEYIGPAILNPIDKEEAMKKITVTDSEIEEHRTRYGTLADQLSNIHDQYASRIADAKDNGNEDLLTTLVEERNKKLEDIKKNFESDAHVEAKIRKAKERVLEQYLNEIKMNSFSLPIAYTLTDVDTGETYTFGDTYASSIYKKEFNASNGYLKAYSLPDRHVRGDWSSISYDDSEVYVTDEDILNMANPVKLFEGEVIIPKTVIGKGGELYSQYKDFNRGKSMTFAFYLIGLLALGALLTVAKFQKEWVTETAFANWYSGVKVDAKIALLFATSFILLGYVESHSNLHNFFMYQSLGRWGVWLTSFIVGGVIVTAFLAFQLVNIIERWKQIGVFEADLKNSYTAQFFKALQEMFLNRSIGVQSFILLIGFFLAGIGFVFAAMNPFLVVVYVFCVVFFALPVLYIFIKRSAYLNRILKATEAMAAGRLNEDIKVEGSSPLAQHAKNLNNLREGVRVSMSEQAKSERLKTELITNVSHDLRTPLTSIITYTDLLKDETLDAEERAKYVDILDKKSQRLKTLIEDLFEVSKMASGNLELNKQRVDLTQLLQQALAEHAEEIAESGLDFRTTFPETPFIAYVDGQRWWRVLDNLIVNAVKYSLSGTRVYITLRKMGDNAEFVVKNITKYELGENVDELFERFKRADTARHTDGSGLGLAIAQSIVDMHNGQMKIELDGDLFKVTVTVPAG